MRLDKRYQFLYNDCLSSKFPFKHLRYLINTMRNKLTKKQTQFVRAARAVVGPKVNTITREQILGVCQQYKMKEPQWLIKPQYRTANRGVYYLPFLENGVVANVLMQVAENSVPDANVMENVVSIKDAAEPHLRKTEDFYENMVPQRDKNFVRFGIYSDLKTIIAANIFYPVFISGLSGNGKSFTPEQICAELKREFFRVNIQKNTNEDDLLGGFRLINGETVWYDGPVTQAAERGALLLLDEIDYGSAEITCMQNVLEGKPFLIKKINRVVTPKPGFNIIATANTKGQGDNVGKFVFTNVLNEAFLERFAVLLEQDYPPASVETKILKNNFKSLGLEDDNTVGDFSEKLVKWANTNRETYKDGGINEIISTRRLVHVVKAYSMFKDRLKAVQICLNRFDDETKSTLYDLYQKIDAAPVSNEIPASTMNPDTNAGKKLPDGGIPF